MRSSIMRLLLAVLLLGGLSEVMRGECSHFGQEAGTPHSVGLKSDCCAQSGAAHDSSGEAEHAQSCHCVCHQVLPIERLAAPFLVERGAVRQVVFVEAASVPPDALPVGIEHPPQLA